MYLLPAFRGLKLTLAMALACVLGLSGAWAQQPASAPQPTFSTPITYDGGPGGAWYVASGVFNRSGAKDLVVANGFGATLSLLTGNGDGTFNAPRMIFTDPDRDSVTAVAVADFNHDGFSDIAFVRSEDVNTQMVVLLGNGKGKFRKTGSASLPVVQTFGPMERSIVVADFNGDGALDIAVTSMNTFVSVMLGDGTGNLDIATDYIAANFPSGLAAGDFNGDGIIDLTLTDVQSSLPPSQEAASVLLPGLGNGLFGNPVIQSLGPNANGINPIALLAQDMNLDGKPDLLTVYKNPVFVKNKPVFGSTLVGSATGQFTRKDFGFALRPGLPTIPSMRALGTADFNHDGKLDAAIAVYNPVSPPSDDVYVLTGNGKGRFVGKDLFFTIGISPVAMVVDDFNGDGKPDIAVALSADGIAITLNTTP